MDFIDLATQSIRYRRALYLSTLLIRSISWVERNVCSLYKSYYNVGLWTVSIVWL